MNVKSLLLIVSVPLSLLAIDCNESYNKNGCNPVTFDVGDRMKIHQYQVIYDNDQDGVSDSKDKCADTPVGTKVDTFGCTKKISVKVVEKLEEPPEEIKIVTLDINFKTAKHDILEKYFGEVNDFAQFMIANSQYSANIVGHTDSRNRTNRNMELSQNRAKAVMNKLLELGISQKRLSYEGLGCTQPIATNETKEGRAQNRRIEVTLTEEGK